MAGVGIAIQQHQWSGGIPAFVGGRIVGSRGKRGKESLHLLGVADCQASDLIYCEPKQRDRNQGRRQCRGDPARGISGSAGANWPLNELIGQPRQYECECNRDDRRRAQVLIALIATCDGADENEKRPVPQV
jgi:hypothetical protein